MGFKNYAIISGFEFNSDHANMIGGGCSLVCFTESTLFYESYISFVAEYSGSV